MKHIWLNITWRRRTTVLYAAKVDDEDYDWLKQWAWSSQGRSGGKVYAVRNEYNEKKELIRSVAMHRFIIDAPEGMEVDHINGDSLDNRRCNLRLATRAQNSQNIGKRQGANKYKGVSRSKSGRYVAIIRANGEQHYLGTFDTDTLAALAYDKAARDLHGEFARLNFPDGLPETVQ